MSARTDGECLVTAVRANPADDAARAALADWLTERGYDVAVVGCLITRVCQGCALPDGPDFTCRDRFGKVHRWEDIHNFNFEHGVFLFGEDMPLPAGGPCGLYDGAWLCEACKRSRVASKANATRKARKAARAVPLFDGPGE